MSERPQTLDEFWPHYLSEHRNAVSRRLHFVGTSGWFAACAASTVANPVGFPLAMAGFGALLAHGLGKGEGEKPTTGHVLAMLALPTLASPVIFPAGVVFAYGCAWAGHFGLEGNKPATFKFPLWSLVSDWRMWGEMARGKLWSGDPLEELGLSPVEERPAQTNGHAASARA